MARRQAIADGGEGAAAFAQVVGNLRIGAVHRGQHEGIEIQALLAAVQQVADGGAVAMPGRDRRIR